MKKQTIWAISLAACMALAMPTALAQDATSGATPPAASGQQMPPAAQNGAGRRGEQNGQQTPPMMQNGGGRRNDQNGQMTPPSVQNGGGPAGQQREQRDFSKQKGNGRMRAQGGQTPPNAQNGNGAAENQDGQTPPELPNGAAPMGQDGQTPPEMHGNQQGGMPGGMPGGFGGGSAPTEYSAANVLTESSSGESYTSTADGENAVLVQGGDVVLSGVTVSKTGASDGESADFYGINAAVLATDGATLTIEGAEITSDGAHANGVFSYGSGTTVIVSDTTITTSANNSGGLMTTGGATLNAENVVVSTAGNSSAAIRSDRGGGTVTVSGGSFDTAGVGSPAIYSTADITVSDATLAASASEAVVIEGGNSVTLNDVEISGDNSRLNGQSTQNTNVLIYQSMSGDAAEGNSTFVMNGGSMTALTGSMFHVTNVTTTIDLSQVDFTYAADSDVFLSASADAWGSSGKNGGNVTLNLYQQAISGAMEVDAVSSLSLNIASGSSYTGAIRSEGAVSVVLAADAVWTLTGDSYIISFDGDLSQVNLNGYTLYVNGVAQ